MPEVTYFVALPFVAADDGIAAGEPTEWFNPNAAVMRAEAYRARKVTLGPSRSAALVIPLQAISAMPR
jgi:hypothetical protein